MIYSFSDFALDTDKAELRHNGEPVQVEPQVFDLIHLLVSSEGRMISKDEVFEAIWGDRVVSDAALSSRIRDARKALGDSGTAQKFIKTVQRRGLQFVPIVTADTPRRSSPSDVLPDLKGKPSIGVLPFRAIGGQEDDAHIASGLTEDVTANLARFKGLLVFSSTTASAMAQGQSPISEMREKFGVDLVLQGSLQRTNDRLRVRMQMHDAATEAILLSEQFERPFSPESQFDIQDEIAGLVAGRVGDLFGPTGEAVARLEPTGRPKSWATIVWLARFYKYTDLRDPMDHAELVEGLTRALQDDANSSNGWAALSLLKIDEYRLPFHYPPRYELRDEALGYAQKAVQLDPSNDHALTALATAHLLKYEVEKFEAAARRALIVNPNNARTLAEIAMCYCLMSDFDRAMPLARRAIELSPVHPGWFRMPIACGLFMQRDAQAALDEQLKAPVPGYFWYHAFLAAFYAELGQMDRAQVEVETVREIYPFFEERIQTEGYVLCVGKPFFDRMEEGWRRAGFDLPTTPFVSGYS